MAIVFRIIVRNEFRELKSNVDREWRLGYVFFTIDVSRLRMSIYIHHITPGLYLPFLVGKLFVSSHKKIVRIAQ